MSSLIIYNILRNHYDHVTFQVVILKYCDRPKKTNTNLIFTSAGVLGFSEYNLDLRVDIELQI